LDVDLDDRRSDALDGAGHDARVRIERFSVVVGPFAGIG
jgi:hypothetical protein